MKHPFWSDQQLAQLIVDYGQERFIAEKMWERGTGKTTAAILRALLQATENPHAWALVDSPDDYSNTARRDRLLTETRYIVQSLPHTQVALLPADCMQNQWHAHLVHPECSRWVYVKFGGV